MPEQETTTVIQGDKTEEVLPAANFEEGNTTLESFFGRAPEVEEKKEVNNEKEVVKPASEEDVQQESEKKADESPAEEEEESKEVSTEEEKKEEEDAAKAEEKAAEVEQPNVVKAQRDDFARFDAATQKYLKKMSTDARQFVIARLDEAAKLKVEREDDAKKIAELQAGRTPVPASYYENPNAVTLLPEYQTVQTQLSKVDYAAAHWRKQLALCKAGEDWQELSTDQQGNLIPGRKFPSTAESEADILDAMQETRAIYQQLAQQEHALRVGFQQKVQGVWSGVRKAEGDFFPKTEWEDNKESVQYKTTEQVAAAIKRLGITEVNPLFSFTAKLGAALLLERQRNKVSAQKQEVKQGIQEDKRKAGPTGSATKGGGSSGGSKGKDDVTVDDFIGAMRKSSYRMG